MTFYQNHDSRTFYRKQSRRTNEGRKCLIDAAIRNGLAHLDPSPERQQALWRLIDCVREKTDLLRPAPGNGSSTGAGAAAFLIARLTGLAARQRFWLRPCEAWRPESGSLRPVFRSLAHHLVALYPVPGFMDSAWDVPLGHQAFRDQSWYMRLARGAKLRALNLPIPLTRHMEHCARSAPDHFSILQALRYGETLGLGGSLALARAVAGSRLGRDASAPNFWRSVLQFLAAHPELPLASVSAIVEAIHGAKFGGGEVLTDQGRATLPPPWPGFSMKGRTLHSLLRLAAAWRIEDNEETASQFSWHPSGLAAFRYLERHENREDLDWSIVELLDSGALYAEGLAMRHCVFAYAGKCRRRASSIWSLRLRVGGVEKRKATIEIDLKSRAVVQVRGPFNRRAGQASRRAIRRWAAAAGLSCP